MNNDEKDYLSLKWGTLKEWHLHSKECQDLLIRYRSLGYSMSAMMQRDTPEQVEIICEIIDKCNADEICLDWTGEMVSKEKAKEYIKTYKR